MFSRLLFKMLQKGSGGRSLITCSFSLDVSSLLITVLQTSCRDKVTCGNLNSTDHAILVHKVFAAVSSPCPPFWNFLDGLCTTVSYQIQIARQMALPQPSLQQDNMSSYEQGKSDNYNGAKEYTTTEDVVNKSLLASCKVELLGHWWVRNTITTQKECIYQKMPCYLALGQIGIQKLLGRGGWFSICVSN